MALSMDEQRILDGMERKLADDDPRLASRLAAFGQPRLPALFGTGKARAVAILMSLALAAMMALMVYSMRPPPASQGRQPHHAARITPSPAGQTTGSGSSGAARPAAPRAS